MRLAILAAVAAMLSGCVENAIIARGRTRLGASAKHVHVYGPDRTDDGHDVWAICRDERRTSVFGPRTYDGACIIYVCAADSASCSES